jgi:hypothetical protein
MQPLAQSQPCSAWHSSGVEHRYFKEIRQSLENHFLPSVRVLPDSAYQGQMTSSPCRAQRALSQQIDSLLPVQSFDESALFKLLHKPQIHESLRIIVLGAGIARRDLIQYKSYSVDCRIGHAG